MSNKKNYYKKNNNYRKKNNKEKKEVIVKKHLTYDELVDGSGEEKELSHELNVSNGSKLLYIKYIGTIIILIIIVILSVIFIRLS